MIIERRKVNRTDRIRVTENLILPQSPESVLEIGAGDYSFDYLKKPSIITWTKADFAQPCDVVCNFNSDNLVLPFADREFEMIICTEVLEHILWPHRLLMELNRVLSEDGMLLVSVPNIASLSYRFAWLFGHIPSCAASGNLPTDLGSTAYINDVGEIIGGHVIDFNKKRLVSLLNYVGFSVEKMKGSGVIWHRQILPYWLVSSALSSNLICLAKKKISNQQHISSDR